MRFAEEHTGTKVRLYATDETGSKRLIGSNSLIAFEGDCDGDIVNGVKIIVGEEGENPANVFHLVESPKQISIVENEETGEVDQITLVSKDNVITTLEIAE